MSMTPLRILVRGLHSSRLGLRFNSKPYLDQVQAFASDIAQRANTVTGYNDIEEIKARISQTEQRIASLKQNVQDKRAAYTSALSNHSAVQRSINDLLHRKHEWTSKDIERLSELYKEDHQTEKKAEETKDEVQQDETSLEAERTHLGRLIMDRYREEQLWSDKIRQFSTWGTMILMAVNVFLFIMVQLIFEPWKRRRLINQFEERLSVKLNIPKQELEDKLLDHEESKVETRVENDLEKIPMAWKDVITGTANDIVATVKSPEKTRAAAGNLLDKTRATWTYLNTKDMVIAPLQVVTFVALGWVIGMVSR